MRLTQHWFIIIIISVFIKGVKIIDAHIIYFDMLSYRLDFVHLSL